MRQGYPDTWRLFILALAWTALACGGIGEGPVLLDDSDLLSSGVEDSDTCDGLAYQRCVADSVHWFNICGEQGEQARQCPVTSECHQETDTEASCRCLDGWAGPDCDVCVRHVSPASVGETPQGLSWSDPFDDIQTAINAAAAAVSADPLLSSCQVWVSAGRYQIYENSSWTPLHIGRGVELYGGFIGVETHLNARSLVMELDGAEAAQSVLDAREEGGSERASAILVIDHDIGRAVVDGFVFTGTLGDYTKGYFGAIHNWGQETEIRNTIFKDNDSGIYSGAINTSPHHSFLETPQLIASDCIFARNGGSYGGALYNESAIIRIQDSVFLENSASYGGAIYNETLDDYGDPEKISIIEDCYFGNNSSNLGGGAVANRGSVLRIQRSVFTQNTSTIGGGVWNDFWTDGSPLGEEIASDLNLVNCLLYENTSSGTGGAVYSRGSLAAVNSSTMWGNAADGAIFSFTQKPGNPPVVSNSIFWGNQTGQTNGLTDDFANDYSDYNVDTDSDTLTPQEQSELFMEVANYLRDIRNNYLQNVSAPLAEMYQGMMTGNQIGLDPLLYAPETGDFKLQPDSPCIGSAEPNFSPADDLTGLNRDTEPDVGAIEYR